MECERLRLPGLLLLEQRTAADARGFFREQYKASAYRGLGLPGFVQDNHSRSVRGVLRGLHYQVPPHAQGKLVSVVRGAILDVAVDLRRGSPTFGRWQAVVLSDEGGQQLWIPEGFAHGFLTLSDEADVVYKVSAEYSAEHERGVRWSDPELAIDWGVREPLLSDRDGRQPLLREAELPFVFSGAGD